jgi:hypothetical protein
LTTAVSYLGKNDKRCRDPFRFTSKEMRFSDNSPNIYWLTNPFDRNCNEKNILVGEDCLHSIDLT